MAVRLESPSGPQEQPSGAGGRMGRGREIGMLRAGRAGEDPDEFSRDVEGMQEKPSSVFEFRGDSSLFAPQQPNGSLYISLFYLFLSSSSSPDPC